VDDNLTRDEARHRASYTSAVSYEVFLDLTGGEDTFRSETTVRFSCNLTGTPTFVDLDAVTLHEVDLNGRRFDVSEYDRDRSRFPVRGLIATNVLRVVADCAYQRTGVGLHRFVDPVDGRVYLHTQFEPFDAHRVFACFDQPDLKASFTLTVQAPEDWVVVSNSPVAEQDGGRWRFSATPPISPYLAAVVAGPYHAVSDSHGPLPLGLYCRESLAAHLDADEMFTVTRQGLDFFDAEFDYPYPFAKYDQVFVPEMAFGAMENPGCVTFNERMVFRSRVTEAARAGRASTVLHEMAHMWFGDLVTMRWWDDLWLNESFATYMASHAQASATRFTDAWVRFASGTKAAAAAQDQLPSTHPISADIVDTDAVRLHFDGITYAKGASVLKQLVAWVGADAFREGVRHYFYRYEWRNATLAEFLEVLEETSGRDLGAWSKEWLETAGIDTLRAESLVDGEGRFTSISVAQEGQSGHDTLRSHRVALGLYDLADGGLVGRRRVELDVAGEHTEVAELAGETAPDLLLVNDDDLAYAKVRLDPRSLATLEAHLGALVDPLARSLCWASAWDMVRDAELPARRWVALVAAHAPAEDDDTALQRLLGQATTALDVYGDPARRGAGRAQLAELARAGLDAADPGSDRQLVWARLLFDVGDGPDAEALARGLLDGSTTVPGLDVDTDLRWHVVTTLAAAGADDGALVRAELERDPTDIGERRAAAALASRPTAAAKKEAWRDVTAEGRALAAVRAAAAGMWQHEQDDLLRPLLGPYLDGLAGWWAGRRREEALTLGRGLFPSTLIEEATVEAVTARLADPDLPDPLRRVLLEGRDALQRALRARAVDARAT
jgi:aminopeptidase N